MDGDWYFAVGNRLDDCFQEQLLVQSSSLAVKRVVMEKLEDIRRNPVTPNPYMLNREPFHFVTTGRFEAGEMIVPPLLIVYSLDHVHRLIFLVHICKAIDVDTSEQGKHSPEPEAEDGYNERPRRESLKRLLYRVVSAAKRRHPH